MELTPEEVVAYREAANVRLSIAIDGGLFHAPDPDPPDAVH